MIKKIVLVLALISTIKISLSAVMIGSVVASGICTIINAWPNKKLFDYSIVEQLKDILPSLILSIVMCVAVISIRSFLHLPLIIALLIQIIFGVFIYLLGSLIIKLDSFYYLQDTIKSFLKKRGIV